MIYFIDFDFTIADTSVCNGIASNNYKKKQKLIPQYRIYKEALELIENANKDNIPIYVVSGNVGSTIKQTIDHFNLPLKKENVIGYCRFMPMDNLQRKIAVINRAISKYQLDKEDIIYIGDDLDDYTACETVGIKFKKADWS